MNKTRLDKLDQKIKPAAPIIILYEDQEPTEEQKTELARAKAAGVEPHILNVRKATPTDALQS